MVAAISGPASTTTHQHQDHHHHLRNQSRPPLLPSEKNNGILSKPRAKQVPSRYMSPSSSTSTSTRRFPSPLLSRSTNFTPPSTPLPSSAPNRSQSVDRRRPRSANTPVHGNAIDAAKLLVTSTRSLSVSFQGEAFSLPISKTKATATPSLSNGRKGLTPEWRRAAPVRDKSDGSGVENSKLIDQHRWPARNRHANLEVMNGIGSGLVVKASNQTMQDDCRRASFDGRLSLDLTSSELLSTVRQIPDADSMNESSVPTDLTTSDTDSVSSGSTSGVQDPGTVVKAQNGPRGIAVSAKFWQETNTRLRRLHDPGSPLSASPGARVKFNQSKRFSSDGSLVSSPRTMASPIRGGARPPSPSKLWSSSVSSPSRGISSPSRTRNGVGNSISMPSILSFSVDIRRGKMGEDRIVDAHVLRLKHNCYLQWRFVNARADATFMLQSLNAEFMDKP